MNADADSADTDRIGSGSSDSATPPAGPEAGQEAVPEAVVETRPAPRKQLKSKKLDRTLRELESAFADWESLSDTKARAAAIEEDRRKAKEAEAKAEAEATDTEKEFRKKTRKLLNQLREQLAELSND